MIFFISVITLREPSPLLSQEGGVGSSRECRVCGACTQTPSCGPEMDAWSKCTEHVLAPSLVVPSKQRICAAGTEVSYQGKCFRRLKPGFTRLRTTVWDRLLPGGEEESAGMLVPVGLTILNPGLGWDLCSSKG